MHHTPVLQQEIDNDSGCKGYCWTMFTLNGPEVPDSHSHADVLADAESWSGQWMGSQLFPTSSAVSLDVIWKRSLVPGPNSGLLAVIQSPSSSQISAPCIHHPASTSSPEVLVHQF